MKHLLAIFFLSLCLSHLSAQEKHFVFIQSDNKQPFYVSLKGKLYSSTATGYVIIPGLTDGNYNFTVGFAQNTFPEQSFDCIIQNKDLGFDLKNFNEKGWGLFNLQSLNVTMASTANTDVVAKALNESIHAKAPAPVITFNKKIDILPADKPVVENASINIKEEDLKQQIAKVDSSKITDKEVSRAVATTSNQSIKNEADITKTGKPADVKKVSEIAGEDGIHLSYVEGSGKIKDTINVIIPSSPSIANSSGASPVIASNNVVNNSEPINQTKKKSSEKKTNEDVKFLDIKMPSKKDSTQVSPRLEESVRILENSNCKNIATENDYAKLRKKMASETTDEKMINEAKKFYRSKCFTTNQIKGLSTLFPSDEGRFKFFDASFVSVADATQYYTLQSEFIDPGYLNRFKALIQ